jgi:hypothetical protein
MKNAISRSSVLTQLYYTKSGFATPFIVGEKPEEPEGLEGEKLAGSLITEVSNPDLVLLALTRQKLCPTIILAVILQQIPGLGSTVSRIYQSLSSKDSCPHYKPDL